MRNDFRYDIFLSYHHRDERKVRSIYERMEGLGLRVFWAKKKIDPGIPFPSELERALMTSQHFMLYWSEGTGESTWVNKEWELFLDLCNLKDKEHRRMYVLMDTNSDPTKLPPLLQNIHRPSSVDQLITELVRLVANEQQERIGILQDQVEHLKRKVEEAQDYYRHRRFWDPIAVNRDIHIFTYARDVPHEPNSSRGYGGRTNIDIWDYRAVLDISRFFSSNYPNTKVTIEDPIRKLQSRDLVGGPRLENHIRQIRIMLEDKDCIIIGSPDVSDFAEVTLARIHKIEPYDEDRIKKKGFVLIKERKFTKSSFYWEKIGEEKEGVAEIQSPNQYVYYPHSPATEDGVPGSMHGILVVANNPFCRDGLRRKIIILSGFSGVATNAIAKILTDEACLSEFFKLVNASAGSDRDIEALIKVGYIIDTNFADRDTRHFNKDYADTITFEKVIEV